MQNTVTAEVFYEVFTRNKYQYNNKITELCSVRVYPRGFVPEIQMREFCDRIAVHVTCTHFSNPLIFVPLRYCVLRFAFCVLRFAFLSFLFPISFMLFGS